MTKSLIPGVGPDAPMVTNEKGGKQSATVGRFDLEPPLAMVKIAEVQDGGAAKYGVWNWRRIHSADHVNHAKAHVHAYIAGDTSEGDPVEHLARAATRMLYALEMALVEQRGLSVNADGTLGPAGGTILCVCRDGQVHRKAAGDLKCSSCGFFARGPKE